MQLLVRQFLQNSLKSDLHKNGSMLVISRKMSMKNFGIALSSKKVRREGGGGQKAMLGRNGLILTLNMYRSSHQSCSIERGVLKNFTKFKMKFVKFLKTPFLQNTSERLLLTCSYWLIIPHPNPEIHVLKII